MSHNHSGRLADELIEAVGTDRHSQKLSALVCVGIIAGLSVTLWAAIYFSVTSLVG